MKIESGNYTKCTQLLNSSSLTFNKKYKILKVEKDNQDTMIYISDDNNKIVKYYYLSNWFTEPVTFKDKINFLQDVIREDLKEL